MPALRITAFQQSFYLGCLRGQLKRNNLHRHILGHYSAGFTLDTYTHVTGDMKKLRQAESVK